MVRAAATGAVAAVIEGLAPAKAQEKMSKRGFWSIGMPQKECRMSAEREHNWGRLALTSAAVAVWLIYDMASAAETPRQAVAILQYALLGCALIGLVGSAVKFISAK